MRRHKDPKRKTTQAQKTPTTPTAATSTGALHPLRGAAPVTWRCTRTEEVHCLRIGCSAPTHKNKRGTDTTHPLPAAPLHAQLGPTGGRMGTPPTPPPAPLPTPTPPTPLHAKSPKSAPRNGSRRLSSRSPGPTTGSSRPSAGLRVSWRPGRAAGCRSGPAGARGDHASRGQARAARAAAATTRH